MYGNSELKMVRFDKWCKTCKHQAINVDNVDISKSTEPCNTCLEIGAREGTEKPEYWEKK